MCLGSSSSIRYDGPFAYACVAGVRVCAKGVTHESVTWVTVQVPRETLFCKMI